MANETAENGTVTNGTAANDDDAFLFNGTAVNVSGASGDVFFDNQDDSIANVTIIEDTQGDGPGFENVRIYENGTVINESGDVVGRVEVNDTTGTPGTEASGDFVFVANNVTSAESGAYVNVSANGTVFDEDDAVVGNVSIVDDNQAGGDGFFDVNIYENGTVVDRNGSTVGEVEIGEVCPTATDDGLLFEGNYVNVSGASGDVFFDNQDDTFVDLRIVDDSQGASDDGFQNVRIYENGTVVSQNGTEVGQVEYSQSCSTAEA